MLVLCFHSYLISKKDNMDMGSQEFLIFNVYGIHVCVYVYWQMEGTYMC